MGSRLSNDDLDFLMSLDDENVQPPTAIKEKKSVGEREDVIFEKLKKLCEKATAQTLASYGKRGCVFEVMTPCVLPCEGGGSANFIGTEELTFIKYMVTAARGEIVCVYKHPETPNTNVFVLYSDIPTIFGKRGWMLQAWADAALHLSSTREEILSCREAADREQRYEGENDYGSW